MIQLINFNLKEEKEINEFLSNHSIVFTKIEEGYIFIIYHKNSTDNFDKYKEEE